MIKQKPCPFCGGEAASEHMLNCDRLCIQHAKNCILGDHHQIEVWHFNRDVPSDPWGGWNRRDMINGEAGAAMSGHDALWEYFGLSYASWITLPRVMMHQMPDEWQNRMAALLNEWDEHWPNQPDCGTRVQLTRRGKLIPMPDWMINYRHPDMDAINAVRGKSVK